jgi:hypothetical protein
MLREALVDTVLEKYSLPRWLKPYVLEYLKGNSTAAAIKRAASFINVGRKKGIITKDEIILPNGTKFKSDQILHLVSLFLYGEYRMGRISRKWAATDTDGNISHSNYFMVVSNVEVKRARAIKSLVQGLGHEPVEPTKELVELFDYIESLRVWGERLLAKKIILFNSFALPFGYIFYRVFYPVSPEFMRSFGTVFSRRAPEEQAGEEEAAIIVQSGGIEKKRLMKITEDVLVLIIKALEAEMKNAKKAGIEREVVLLKDVAIACPLHRLKGIGVDFDVEEEISRIKKMANRGMAPDAAPL